MRAYVNETKYHQYGDYGWFRNNSSKYHQNSTWTRLGLSESMSRSDFLTYATYAALDVATAINNRDCGGISDADCFMPEMQYRDTLSQD